MKYLKKIWEVFLGFFGRLTDDHITAFAAMSAYFILMSIIPILMLMLTLTRFLPITQQNLTEMFFSIIPVDFQGLVSMIIAEAFNKTAVVVPLTVIFAAWASSKGVLGLYTGMNSIYHTQAIPNYFIARGLSALYTVLFILAIVFTLVLMVFGTSIQGTLIHYLPFVARVTGVFVHFRIIITWIILMLVFLVLYVVLPNRKASFKSQLPGAMLASLGWLLFSYIYSMYVQYTKSFSNMYGSMTTIILLMLWLYLGMCILLIGAEINAYFEDRFRRMQRNYYLHKENFKRQILEDRDKRQALKQEEKQDVIDKP